MSFGSQNQINFGSFAPLSPYQGFAINEGAYSAVFRVYRVSRSPRSTVVLCSNNLGAFGATDVTFLSVPTPVILFLAWTLSMETYLIESIFTAVWNIYNFQDFCLQTLNKTYEYKKGD